MPSDHVASRAPRALLLPADVVVAARARLLLAQQVGAHVATLACGVLASGDLGVVIKPDGSPVTKADKLAERVLREAILRDFPHDAILGEEEGSTQGQSGFRWVIDPIDGTKSFVAGIPTFGTLIGLEWTGKASEQLAKSAGIIAGFAVFPLVREQLWALAGEGAWWRCETQGGTFVRSVQMTQHQDITKAVIETGSYQTFARGNKQHVFEALTRSTQRARSWNDAYSFALAATGRVDAAVGFKASLWDLAPFAIIASEAGGAMTNWQGQHALETGTYLLASDGLRAELVKVLGE